MGGKIKRVNYDLHNVLGFYAFAISFVLTVTGLILAFKPYLRLPSLPSAATPRTAGKKYCRLLKPGDLPTICLK